MSTFRRTRGWRGLALTGGIVFALAAAGCGGGDDTDDGAAATTTGTGGGEPLTMAADPSLVPYNFFGDGGKEDWQGINIDISAALAKQLGREITVESVPFDSSPGSRADATTSR
jgi:ABC-type amino acid transport substrate-binding protein